MKQNSGRKKTKRNQKLVVDREGLSKIKKKRRIKKVVIVYMYCIVHLADKTHLFCWDPHEFLVTCLSQKKKKIYIYISNLI